MRRGSGRSGIVVPQEDLDDLRTRLAATRWPDHLPGTGWDYGMAPLEVVQDLAEYWRDGYDWRVHERRLKTFPQFTTDIDGQGGVHFHCTHALGGAGCAAADHHHGWPGSIAEFMDVIGPLTDPTSLRRRSGRRVPPRRTLDSRLRRSPGPTRDRGWDVSRVARAWDVLMRRIGYERYGAQGGDWGSAISRELGLVAPEHLIGIHLNTLFPQARDEPADLTDQEKARLEAMRRFRSDGSGYFMIQATRPQTVAYALTDSPAGQLAWIAEKFHEWTDGGLPGAVDRDQLLTNVTLYWLTGTAGSSARLYFEAARSGSPGPPAVSTVPTGVAVFPREIAPPIRRFAEQSNTIVHWSEFDRGGHFAAMEEPDLLVGDVREFFRLLR